MYPGDFENTSSSIFQNYFKNVHYKRFDDNFLIVSLKIQTGLFYQRTIIVNFKQ